MNHRADYLLQVLEKIGAPLMASVIEAQARAPGREPAQQLHNEAQKIAELLAKTVQASIEMGNSLDLGPMGDLTDSIRIALTGLASPLVAGSFRLHGKAPGDPEMKRMIAALQAVLTFAENFEANTENADRLRNIQADGGKADAAQEAVQYINAYLPVVNAIAAFSFGQNEQKLIMEAASRISVAAKMLQQKLFANLGAEDKRFELGVLSALGNIYAACHRAETARVQAMNDDQRVQMQADGTSSSDIVWKNFEIRAAMIEQLARGIALPAGKTNGSSAGRQPQPAVPVAPMTAPQAEKQAAFASPPAHDPLAHDPFDSQILRPSPPQQTATAQGGSPMSFFKAPPKEGAGGA